MLRSTLLIILFAFSGSVYADGFSYNSVTASYGQIDFDDLNADGDILSINGSAAIGESFFVFGGFGMADISDNVVSADVDSWDVGIGYHMPMSDSVDFVSSSIDMSTLHPPATDNVQSKAVRYLITVEPPFRPMIAKPQESRDSSSAIIIDVGNSASARTPCRL